MAKKIMCDANEAVAKIAFACSEVAAIYPITPSSPMGEFADEWAAHKQKNLWDTVPQIVELQSEAGAAGAVHGALTTGSLTTTFTASQGLLLMIPNMYTIAGELTPAVFHVTARSLAMQGLCIFGDHGDVMACRQTGFAMLASNSVQEAHDLALVAHAATLETKIPFLHFFDGFRTSHEVQKIDEIDRETIRQMIDEQAVNDFRARGLTPENPTMRGTAQNPDVYFQGRETVNKYYDAVPAIVQKLMDKLASMTGRSYKLFDYEGALDAERIIVLIGSGAECVHEVVEDLTAKGEKVGVIKVRLYRPFDVKAFAAALPQSVKAITVLDRTKEPGSIGEPLYTDVRTALGEAMQDKLVTLSGYPKTLAGRYGLGSKEFTPAMVKAIFDNMSAEKPVNHFAVGIVDDITGNYLKITPYELADDGRTECMFYGLGSDGTVGANKNSIKVIGNNTDNYAQGYFVYDSKKAGGLTVSHLRFGPKLIRSTYLCTKADFIACHNFSFLEKYDMLSAAKPGATFLLQSEYDAATVWDHIPDEVAKVIIEKRLKFYVVNAVKVAKALGLGGRTNTIMQTAFFVISGIIEADKAVELLKAAAKKAYGKKGDDVVKLNWDAIDAARGAIEQVTVPAAPAGKLTKPATVSADAPDFVKNVTAVMMRQEGDSLPVSAIPDDGTWPTATTQFEKRNIATDVPVWDPAVCIQCMRCSTVCPHAAIRGKIVAGDQLAGAPETFRSADVKPAKGDGKKFTIQVSLEDCTGCTLCVKNCPMAAKGALKMTRYDQDTLRKPGEANWKFFMNLPETDVSAMPVNAKSVQLKRPLFEFSGACAGCGETPYVKLLTQICGNRLCIANATGCSSIYGGNLPTTPYCKDANGKGPAWSNSLFEDNAEFGLGMAMTRDKQKEFALELIAKILASGKASADYAAVLQEAVAHVDDQKTDADVDAQRARVAKIKAFAAEAPCCELCAKLITVADFLIRRSIWIIGGDGWAYDIGYGGVDHVLATGRNVKILVLDTEVYSNTGGQASKSTPLGAVAKFAAGGKPMMKKDLAAISMTYKNIYVAQVSIGTNPEATVKAFAEAEAYDGPALIIAYAHCIAHGINLSTGLEHQKMAVESGHFPLFRYNPDLVAQGKNPLQLDSKAPSQSFVEVAKTENRFKQLAKVNPEHAAQMLADAEARYARKYQYLQTLAGLNVF
ncbi:MAG: pyruvate:ferredoxin (flavodoxin) oxidoreductase [Kiritimatiellia bacterium]|nr:pyruvate:ferredoxin (flavodoxin) oxidoreductase [Kiritimatiellia bacterium]